MFRRDRSFVGAAAAALLSLPVAGFANAQDSAVVSSEVTVSGDRASLRLELEDGQVLSVVFTDGDVELDGEVIGEYQEGGALERSWRALLGEAASLDPAQIPALLGGWTPPAELQGAPAEVAEQLRGRLSLEAAGNAPPLQNPGGVAGGNVADALRALVGRPERLRALAEVSDEIDSGPLEIHVSEDVTIGLGETRRSSLLVVDGDVEINGTLDGDLVLLGANADLGPDGRITGSVFHSDADIDGDLDGIEGEVDEIDSGSVDVRSDRLRDVPERPSVEAVSPSPFRSIGRGLSGLLSTFVTFAIAFAAGLGILYFFPRNLELVSRAARHSAGKSLLVGLAGFVLAIPVWVIGTVLLAISIIGIPLLLVWVPLYPAALAGAVGLGSIGVARNLGGWVSRREFPSLSGMDTSRPALQIGAGLAVLLAAFAISNVFEMAEAWLGVFEHLFWIVGIVVLVLSAAVGFGAVILSRAGRVQTLAGAGASTADSGFAGEDASLNV